eukprot:s1199_g16.t1
METSMHPRVLFAQLLLLAMMDSTLTAESCYNMVRVLQAILQTLGAPTSLSTTLELFRAAYAAHRIAGRHGFTIPNAIGDLPQPAHPAAGVPFKSFEALIHDAWRTCIQQHLAGILLSLEVLVTKADQIWPANRRYPVQRLVYNSVLDARSQLQNLQLCLQHANPPNHPQLIPEFDGGRPGTPPLWGE